MIALYHPKTTDERNAILDWIGKQIREQPVLDRNSWAVGVVRDGKLLAGAAYLKRGHNIELSFASASGRWASPDMVAAILGYGFFNVNGSRLTAVVHKKNRPVRKLLEGIGFKLEGVHPDVFDPHPGMSYGMTKRFFEASDWMGRLDRRMAEKQTEQELLSALHDMPPLGDIRPAAVN